MRRKSIILGVMYCLILVLLTDLVSFAVKKKVVFLDKEALSNPGLAMFLILLLAIVSYLFARYFEASLKEKEK